MRHDEMTDATAREEASHIMAIEAAGIDSSPRVFLSDDPNLNALLTFEVDSETDPRMLLRAAVSGKVGAYLHEDRNAHNWRTLGATLLTAQTPDGVLLRHALAPFGFTRDRAGFDNALDLIAEVAGEWADTLRSNRKQWKQTTDSVLAGDYSPRTPGGYVRYPDGRALYFAESFAPAPALALEQWPEVDPFVDPPPEPKRTMKTLFGLRKSKEGRYEITEDEVVDV